jgi:hypothetical protein
VIRSASPSWVRWKLRPPRAKVRATAAAAWRRWLEHDDGFFVVLHGKLIARR